MPGSYGTMGEYFEAPRSIQTRKINDFPVIIFYREFHKVLIEHIELMYTQMSISDLDRRLYLVTDSIKEAVELIKERCIKRYQHVSQKSQSPLRLLVEHKW